MVGADNFVIMPMASISYKTIDDLLAAEESYIQKAEIIFGKDSVINSKRHRPWNILYQIYIFFTKIYIF